MIAKLKRREFITLLGGATVGWPLAARGQQPERIRRIGALSPFPADDPEAKARMAAFLHELAQFGWVIVAVMRKMITTLNAMVRDDIAWADRLSGRHSVTTAR